MPENGNNLIDTLSVEISASVDPSIKAIDSLQQKLNMLSGSLQHFTDAGKYKSALDNMAKGFERLSQVVGGIDFDALANVSSGINSVSKAMTKFSDATRNIEKTFSGTTKSAETLANAVERELTQEFNKLGITGDKEIKELSEDFADLGKTFNDMTDGVPGAWDATEAKLGEMKQKLRDMSSIADETAISMKDVLAVYNDIRGQQANSVKLPKGISTMYSGGDGSWMAMRQTVGAVEGQGRGANIFAPQDDPFKNLKAINFEAFYSDLQSAHGHELFPDLKSDEEQFMRLYDVMRMAKGEIDSLSEGGNTLKISLEEAEGKAFDFAQAAGAIAKNFQSVETTTQESSGFSQMLESLKSLAGVSIPDLSGLNPISSLASKVGGDKGTAVGDNLTKIFDALRSGGGNLSIPDFSGLTTLAKAVEKLGNSKSQNATWVLPNVMAELESFSGHFNGLTLDTSVITTISQLGSAFGRLGGKNATEAITNLPQLSDAIRQVVDDLNNLPQVSQQTQDLIVALGQLAKSHGNVANATKGVTNSHNVASQALQKFTSRISSAYNSSNFLASAYNKVKDGVSNFTQSMDRASSHTQSLTMVIVKARTLLWGFRRIFSMFSGSLELASSLTEVQNVIDNVFTENYAAKVEDMSKAVKDSLGMSELSFKQYASRYQAMGKAMGITNSQMISAQDNLKGMGVAYGETNSNMQDMSVNLTRLAADLASFYDIDQKTAFEKLQAVYTGQTRPLRALGIDLTQATLQEWAMKNGIDANISSMTQAEKTMLRYQYVLAQTTAAHGDYARTIRSWHNQIILLKENFKSLGIIVGSGLIQAIKPFVMAMNAAFNAVLTFSTNVLNALGQIFGWEVETFARGSSLEDFADTLDGVSSDMGDVSGGADDTASGLDKADKAAKKLKATILGFDELNVLNGNDDDLASDIGSGSGSGSGSGIGAGGGIGGGDIGDIDYVIKKTDSKFKSAIDNLYDLGKYISDSLADVLDKINWDNVYKKAENFGKGLADFLNGLVQPHTFESLGRTVGNSINTALKALNTFGYTFDFRNLGESVSLAIQTAFESINFGWLSNTAWVWGRGIADYINGLVNPEMFGTVGDSIAEALNAAVIGAIGFSSRFSGENIGKSFGAAVNHALSGIEWSNVLTEAHLLAQDISDAINAFVTPENFAAIGTTVGKGISTAINFALELGQGIDFGQLADSFNSFIGTALENIKAEDVAETINTWVSNANEFLDGVDLQPIVDFIFDVLSRIDWGGVAKLKLRLNFDQTATSIASGIAGAFSGNPVKDIVGGGISLLGFAMKLKFLQWAGILTPASTAAGAATGGGFIASLTSSLAPLAPLLGGIGVAAGAAAFLIYGYLAAQDPEVQKRIEEGKQYLKQTREDETKNWEMHYKGLHDTADKKSEETYTTIEGSNKKLKESYDSLGRKIGEVVDGDYSSNMNNMQSIGERAAEGIQNAFEAVTDFFSRWDFPTWHVEWEQHEEGGYGFSLPKIVRYASGGFPDAGLFFANEYGNPEMIGTIGHRPAVANNDQITTAIRGAVVDGMMQVFMATGGFGGEGGSPTVEVTVRADSETLYKAVRKGEQKYNRRYSVVAQM